jgi:TldD protein
MTFSRRDFIKTAGLTLGALTLPSWIYDAQAATNLTIDVNKNNLADAALSTAKKLGANYADIRINRYRLEAISTRERQVQNVSSGQNFGFGVRVLVNGTWGFAASPIMTEEEVRRDCPRQFRLSAQKNRTCSNAESSCILEKLFSKRPV